MHNQHALSFHEEYDWELENQSSEKDDFLLPEPLPCFPNMFGDFFIHDFACVSSSMDAPIVDHSKNTPDVIPSSKNGEDKLLIENPLDFSSTFYGNTEAEFFCLSSTTPFYSSDHEYVDEIIDFDNCSFRDIFTPVFHHDDDSIIVYFLKPPVYDDLSVDEVENPQTIEAL